MIESRLQQARELAASGDLRAIAAFSGIVEEHPDCIEAHVFLASVAMANGRYRDALAQMRSACSQVPDNPHLRKGLGDAAAACGENAEAIAALRAAVAMAPYRYDAFLALGKLLEAQGEADAAVRAYFRALTRARIAEQWQDPQALPERLRADVLHAIAVVSSGRVRVLGALMQPLLARFGATEMARVHAAFHDWLGGKAIVSPEPAQKPTFLFLPGIPCTRYLDPATVPGVDGMVEAYPDILAEASRLLQDGRGFQPFLEFGSKARPADYLASEHGGAARWDAYFFHRHGEPFPEHLAACPRTAAALDRFPVCRIAGHAPEICFSLLAPDSHILPHHGVSNIRVVIHLPLVVPPGCALRVAGEEHAWQPGRPMVFDDTFEHEAWNRSTEPRLILLMDAWNPHLAEAERIALAELIQGIGEFNRG